MGKPCREGAKSVPAEGVQKQRYWIASFRQRSVMAWCDVYVHMYVERQFEGHDADCFGLVDGLVEGEEGEKGVVVVGCSCLYCIFISIIFSIPAPLYPERRFLNEKTRFRGRRFRLHKE